MKQQKIEISIIFFYWSVPLRVPQEILFRILIEIEAHHTTLAASSTVCGCMLFIPNPAPFTREATRLAFLQLHLTPLEDTLFPLAGGRCVVVCIAIVLKGVAH